MSAAAVSAAVAPAAPSAGDASSPQARPARPPRGDGFTSRGRGERGRGGRGRGGRGKGADSGEPRPPRTPTEGKPGKGPKAPRPPKPAYSAPPAGSEKDGRASSPEFVALKARAGDYYPEDILLGALKATKNDVEAAYQLLNAQKQSSWSSVVAKSQGAPLVAGLQTEKKEKPKAAEQPAEKPAEKAAEKPKPIEKPVDAEAKINELAKVLDVSVRETESRAQALKTFKNDLEAISAPRDAEIAKLTAEKAETIARNAAIREELAANEKRLKAIDADVERLKKEKVELTAALEAKAKTVLAEITKGK